MTRNPLRSAISATYGAFDFLTPAPRLPFAVTMAKFTAAFAVGYAVQWSGILAPGIARGNEILVALLVLLFLPILAAITRRLTDARMPLILSVLPLLLRGLAAALAMFFDADTLASWVDWLAVASVVALAVALCMPSRAAPAPDAAIPT